MLYVTNNWSRWGMAPRKLSHAHKSSMAAGSVSTNPTLVIWRKTYSYKKFVCLEVSYLCMMTSSNGNIFSRYWPFVRGIHRSPVVSPHKGQWRGALMFSLICTRNLNRDAGDLRRHHAHHDVTVMVTWNHDPFSADFFRKRGWAQPMRDDVTW